MQLSDLTKTVAKAWEAIAGPILRLLLALAVLQFLTNSTLLASIVENLPTVASTDADSVLRWIERFHLAPLVPLSLVFFILVLLHASEQLFHLLGSLIPILITTPSFPKMMSNTQIAFIWSHSPKGSIWDLIEFVEETYSTLKSVETELYGRHNNKETIRLLVQFQTYKSLIILAILPAITHLLVNIPVAFCWDCFTWLIILLMTLSMINAVSAIQAQTSFTLHQWWLVHQHFTKITPTMELKENMFEKADANYDERIVEIANLKSALPRFYVQFGPITWLRATRDILFRDFS